jgi:DNA processing protein
LTETIRALVSPDESKLARQVEALERSGASLLTPFEGPYPRLLREIPDAPLVLYALGNVEKLALPAVGIVGARAATQYGREVAAGLAHDLSGAGVCVISGMARGIDAAAHGAAIEGPGGTMAVLGCGIDIVYPVENRKLWRRIEKEGLLLTEYAPGIEPHPRNFPIRNRVIAGMSSGVVVVEAAEKSGSLITAKFANDFGRDVFAVPGLIHSEASRGCHALLRDGAILCRGAEDVLSEIFPSIGLPALRHGVAESLDGDSGLVLRAMAGADSWSADDLADATNLSVSTILIVLFDLESRGFVRSLPGGLYGPVQQRA